MKTKNIIGALLLFAFAVFAMPAIAAPADSPPRAETAKENTKSDMQSEPITGHAVTFAISAKWVHLDTPSLEHKNRITYEPRSYPNASGAAITSDERDTGDH